MPDSTYHQIHFAWAEPTLLGRNGPGPAASSLPESEQPVLRSWRDRLIPALTADYRSALPDSDPADYPETLWARAYPDGQAALVYRWPGDVRSAHAWAIVGPAHGLVLPRVLCLHENPNTRPAESRPPRPGWATMGTLPVPDPWERTAAPGAVRTRDRRAAESTVEDEPILVGAVAAALDRPDLPIHIALAPDRADLWQAVQLRFLWGMHRVLHDVLTPPRAIPAAGWSWSFSTYDPVLGTTDGQHLAFGPAVAGAPTPFLNPPSREHRRIAEGLVEVLREEGGDALAEHLRERGVPEAPTFADRRALLYDWLDPAPAGGDGVPVPERLPDTDAEEAPSQPDTGQGPGRFADSLPDLPEVEAPGEEETGPQGPARPRTGRVDAKASPGVAVPGGQPSLKGLTVWDATASSGRTGGSGEEDGPSFGAASTAPADNEALWPREEPGPAADASGNEEAEPGPGRRARPRLAPAHGRSGEEPELPSPPPGVFEAPAFPREARVASEDSSAGGEGQTSLGALGTGGGDAPAEPRTASSGTRGDRGALDGRGERAVAAPHREGEEPPPARGPVLTNGPEDRAPADAPPLPVVPDTGSHGGTGEAPAPEPDYAAETEPGPADPLGRDSGGNWPAHYVDLPLARLERWHAKRGPEGARVDVADARAAVRAERAELQRVREERDHYHAEVQELRRDVARLDRPWLDGSGGDEAPEAPRSRRWPVRVLVAVVLVAFLAVGLEAGARFGVGVLDLFGTLAAGIAGGS